MWSLNKLLNFKTLVEVNGESPLSLLVRVQILTPLIIVVGP